VKSGSGPAGPGDEHDRTVVPALGHLVALTAPTDTERSRIRARILASLNQPTTDERAGAAEQKPPKTAVLLADDPLSAPEDEPATRPGEHKAKDRTRRETEPAATRPPTRGRTGQKSREHARPGVLSGARGRFAIAAVAVLALVGSLAGMSLLLARDALPGDALYGIKRTAEAASLGLTFGDEPKALKHLEFAGARVSEIETLARRYPNPADAPVGGYLTALTDFDNDAASGSRQLIALATSADGSQLESLQSWARQQTTKLTAVAPRLPSAARGREGVSLALLDKITARSTALLTRMDCYQITSGTYDDIGALPAGGACDQNPGIDPSLSASQPSVPDTTDSSGTTTNPQVPGAPLPPVQPTPDEPLLPLPGATVAVPAPTTRPGQPTAEPPADDDGTIVLPLPLPTVELPPLLPGLPGIRIGK